MKRKQVIFSINREDMEDRLTENQMNFTEEQLDIICEKIEYKFDSDILEEIVGFVKFNEKEWFKP